MYIHICIYGWVHWGVQALTVICDLLLQARQLVDAALGGARDELLPQSVAVQGLGFSIPIHSHVVQSIRKGQMRMRGGRRGGGEEQQSRNDNAKISRLSICPPATDYPAA